MSTQSFVDLGVSSTLSGVLARRGITQPFPVQSMVIGDVLAGRDVLVKSPTGSGKTLAFGVPIVERTAADGPRPAVLVLAPTRELAIQIADELRAVAHARALRITAVYGGVGLTRQAASAAASHIVVATPGRLEDLLQRGALTLAAVRVLVLDEADRMLDMGFRPAVDRIARQCPRSRQTIFLSATLDGAAGDLADAYTRDAVLHEVDQQSTKGASAIEHRFVTVAAADRVEALVAELAAERDLALVFVRTKRGADRLVKRLDAQGVRASALHGNKSQRQRQRALADFEAGHVDTLVATDIAARGIDLDGISHVINFDPPADHDAYVHRIGRTGRAGRPGIGITLATAAEQHEMRRLAHLVGIAHDRAAPHDRGAQDGRAAADGRGDRRTAQTEPRRRSRRRRPRRTPA